MLTVVVALGAGGMALAQVSPRVPELETAQQQVDAGDFEDAISTLEKGLARPDLTDDQLVELYKLLGLSHLYLGNEERARSAFEKLLQARPDYEVPKASPPKVRSLYARIKEDIKKRRLRPVTLTLTRIAQDTPGGPLQVDAHIEDLTLGAKAKLFFRRAGDQAYSSVDFVRAPGSTENFSTTVPAFEVPEGEQLEYYVEVADAAQRRLAGKGDAYNPLVLRIARGPRMPEADGEWPRPGEERPWYKSPWVWIGVGVGVAAITTTAVVLATQRQTATVQVDVMVKLQ